MSSDDDGPPEFQPQQPVAVERKTKMEHLKDLVIAFKWPITIATGLLVSTVAVAIAVGALDLTGWPRDAMLALGTVTVTTIFIGPTLLLVGFWLDLRSRVPVVHCDEDLTELHADLYAPDAFSEVAWKGEDGAEPVTLTSDAGSVYLAREQRVEQVEQVNEDSGEKELSARHAYTVPWPGEANWLEFVQRKKTLKKQWNTLVPLAVEAVDAQASKGTDVLDSTMTTTMNIIRGVEDDVLFDRVSGDRMGDDLDDFEEYHSFDDDQEDRADRPDPTSKEMDERLEQLADAKPPDGGVPGDD